MEDDIDIYEDLPEFGKNDNDPLESSTGKRKEEENEQLKTQVAKLTEELESFKKAKSNLEVNLSSLLKTAKAELARKDRTISELRSKLDNFAFRRGAHAKPQPRYQHAVPVRKQHLLFQTVEDATYNAQPDEEYFAPQEGYSYHKKEEEEDEDDRVKKEQLMRASKTVFGERLRKRLVEEEQLDKEQKSNMHVEKVTESDKENNLVNHKKSHMVVDQSVILESNETKFLNAKTSDQELSNTTAPSHQRKRVIEEEVQEKHVKRKRDEKYEMEMETSSYPEFLDHSNQVPQSYNHALKKRHKSTYEHDRTHSEYRKYRHFDEAAVNQENKDTGYELSYHKRSLDKHTHGKRYSPETQSSIPGRSTFPSRFSERLHHKDRIDYRTDYDYSQRHWNKHKDRFSNNKYDRHMLQTLHENEHEHSFHRIKRTRLKKRENKDDFTHGANKVGRFSYQDSRIQLKSTKKLREGQLSAWKNDNPDDGIHKDVKYRRRNSTSSSKSEEPRRSRRSSIPKMVKSESMEGSNPKVANQQSSSFAKLDDIPKPHIKEDQIDCTDKEENARVDNNDVCANALTDNDSCLEDGELPSSPDSRTVKKGHVKNETFTEDSKNENSPAIDENTIDENKEKKYVLKHEEHDSLPNECIRDTATLLPKEIAAVSEAKNTEIIVESVHFDETTENKDKTVKTPDEVSEDSSLSSNEPIPDNTNATKETDVPTKAATELDNDEDIIGIFGDGKEVSSLTVTIQDEKENDVRVLENPTISNQENIVQEIIEHIPLVLSRSLTYNDSIEKKLEIMESSTADPNTASKFFEAFHSTGDAEIDNTVSKPPETVEASACEKCPIANPMVDETVENELNNSNQTKSSTLSSSSSQTSSSSPSSSSSSSSSTSLSTSSESDESVVKEDKKEETVTETVPAPLEISATDIDCSSSPCAAETTKLDTDKSDIVPKPSCIEEEIPKELPATENHSTTPASPVKQTRKREVEPNDSLKLNGRVVVVVRRRRPVRLSNNSNVTVVVSPKISNPCVTQPNGLSEGAADTKPRACRTPRLKNS